MIKNKSSFLMLIFFCSFQSAIIANFSKNLSSETIAQRMDMYVQALLEAPYCKDLENMLPRFTFERVDNVFQTIAKNQSYKPLAQAWQAIKSQPPINLDEVAEFSVALIIIYSSVILHLTENEPKRINWLSLIALYAQLSRIPLGKLFDVLEECWQRYQEIMALFPKDEKQSWHEWLQENWWVPTTVVFFALISFVRWSQSHSKNNDALFDV